MIANSTHLYINPYGLPAFPLQNGTSDIFLLAALSVELIDPENSQTTKTQVFFNSLMERAMTESFADSKEIVLCRSNWFVFKNKTDCHIFGEANYIPLMENVINPMFLKDGNSQFVCRLSLPLLTLSHEIK